MINLCVCYTAGADAITRLFLLERVSPKAL